jgi:heptosyltransferase-3
MPCPAPILLIFHPGALGDGLLALTALRVLQTKFPGHCMIWIGHKELGDVYVDAHEVHQAYSFESLNFFADGAAKGLQQGLFSSLFGRCERAVGWMEDSGGIWRSWLRTLGINNLILRSPHDPSLQHDHMADRYVETLQPWFPTQQPCKPLKKNVDDERLLVFRQSKTVEQPGSSEERLIVLHPGSGSLHKCSPPALCANIVNGLMARPHRRVCLVGGPADRDSLRKVQGLLTHHEPTILEGLDLLSVGRYLQHARLFIGHDSGLSHLATRLGVPSVLLFGPTDPAKWAPRGKHVAVMRNSCQCVGKASIAQCIDKRCFSIPTNEVIAKAEEVLCGMNVSASREPLGCVEESPHVPCLG